MPAMLSFPLTLYDAIIETLQSVPPWLSVPTLIVGAIAVAKLLDVVLIPLFERFAHRSETVYDDILFEELHAPVVISVVLFGLLLAVDALPTETAVTIPIEFELVVLTVLVVIWMRTLNRIGNRILDEAKDAKSEYASFAPVFSNLLTFSILVGGLFFILALWRIDITPLMASAGIAGIAVGFAAKDTVANFFGGLALYFDRTYKVGDFIELDSGDKGTVVKVGIRSTTLLTRDEVMVTVPNSVLNSSRIINQSAPQRRKRIRAPVTVAYGTDIDELEAVLLDVTESVDVVLDSPTPRFRFRRFGDSALEYEIRAWIPTPIRETKTVHELNRAMYKRFATVGIEIPFPQRDVYLRNRTLNEDDANADVEANTD